MLKWSQTEPGFFCFLLIQALPTFWAEQVSILRNLIFWILFDPKFTDFRVPWFPDFQTRPGPDLGRAWAGLGLWPGLGRSLSVRIISKCLLNPPPPNKKNIHTSKSRSTVDVYIDLAASAWADGRQGGRPPSWEARDRRAIARRFFPIF